MPDPHRLPKSRPRFAPQMTLYVPGPVLHEGRNELVLLELEAPPSRPTGERCPLRLSPPLL